MNKDELYQVVDAFREICTRVLEDGDNLHSIEIKIFSNQLIKTQYDSPAAKVYAVNKIVWPPI